MVTEDRKRYTLLWIPKNGLFFDGARFTDGTGNTIQWDRTIRLFASHKRGMTARDRILKRFPDAHGELILLNVQVQEVDGGEDSDSSGS